MYVIKNFGMYFSGWNGKSLTENWQNDIELADRFSMSAAKRCLEIIDPDANRDIEIVEAK